MTSSTTCSPGVAIRALRTVRAGVLTHFARLAHAATGVGQIAVGRTRQGAVGGGHSYEEAFIALDVAQRMGLDAPSGAPPPQHSGPAGAGALRRSPCSTRSPCTSTPAAWQPPRPGARRSACAR